MRIVDCNECPLRKRGELLCSVTGLLDEIAAVGRFRVDRRPEVVFDEGEPANGLHLICHGAVKLFSANPSSAARVFRGVAETQRRGGAQILDEL